jgi:hypothetical protein
MAIWIPAVRTVITPQEAVAGFRVACKRRWNTTRPETVAVLTAQSALESARWAAMWRFNPSNIKASPAYEGLYCTIKLNEQELRDGKKQYVWYEPRGELLSKSGPIKPGTETVDPPGHRQCWMRAFQTFGDGVNDKLAFLDRPKREAAKAAALAGKPDLYVHECHKIGYFTADEAPYMRACVSLFKTFLPLARKQTEEPVPLPPEEEERTCIDMAECLRFELPEWLRNRVAQITALTASEMWDRAAEEIRKGRDADVAEDEDDGKR